MLPWDRGDWGDFSTRTWFGLFLPTATFVSPCFFSVKHVMAMCRSVRSKLSLLKQTLTHTHRALRTLFCSHFLRDLRNTGCISCLFSASCRSLLLVGSWAAHQVRNAVSQKGIASNSETCSGEMTSIQKKRGRGLKPGLLWEAILEKDIGHCTGQVLFAFTRVIMELFTVNRWESFSTHLWWLPVAV